MRAETIKHWMTRFYRGEELAVLYSEAKAIEEENAILRKAHEGLAASCEGSDRHIEKVEAEVYRLKAENEYLRAGCQDEENQCPILSTNNTAVVRIRELEASLQEAASLLDEIVYNEDIMEPHSLTGTIWKADWLARARKIMEATK